MAFWNPFGWSEEDRMAIQSIVRPITQVASLASSMGVSFAGSGGADTVAGSTDAAAGVQSPTTDTGGLNEALTGEPGITETLIQPGVPDTTTVTPDQQAGMQGMFNTDATGGQQPFDPNAAIIDSGAGQIPQAEINQDWNMNPDFNPTDGSTFPGGEEALVDPWTDAAEAITDTQFKSNASTTEGLVVEPFKKQPGEQYEVGDIIDESKPYGNAQSTTTDADGNIVVTGVTPETTQTTAEQVSTNANDTSAATPTAKSQQPETNRQKVTTSEADPETDTRGKGGKDEDKFWDLHDFSWENLGNWLETKEGRKFFLEWGAKFTAMSGGGAPNRKKLTKKQAAAIRKKVKEKYGR